MRAGNRGTDAVDVIFIDWLWMVCTVADSMSSAAQQAMRQSMLSNDMINNDLSSYLQDWLRML